MTLRLPPPLPVATVLGAIDKRGRTTATAAGTHTLAAVRSTLPSRSGRLRQGTRRSVRRTPTGYVIEVAPTSRVRYPNGVTAKQVGGWVEGGTGIHGPRHKRITPRRAKAFRLPSGWAKIELEGQRAQHPFSRVQTSEEGAVQRILEGGAQLAARDAERALEGGR